MKRILGTREHEGPHGVESPTGQSYTIVGPFPVLKTPNHTPPGAALGQVGLGPVFRLSMGKAPADRHAHLGLHGDNSHPAGARRTPASTHAIAFQSTRRLGCSGGGYCGPHGSPPLACRSKSRLTTRLYGRSVEHGTDAAECKAPPPIAQADTTALAD
jgi:hypothetical protein